MTSEHEPIGVGELRSGLSEYVRRVEAGEHLIVTKNGKPVARLVPYDVRSVPVEPDHDGVGDRPVAAEVDDDEGPVPNPLERIASRWSRLGGD